VDGRESVFDNEQAAEPVKAFKALVKEKQSPF